MCQNFSSVTQNVSNQIVVFRGYDLLHVMAITITLGTPWDSKWHLQQLYGCCLQKLVAHKVKSQRSVSICNRCPRKAARQAVLLHSCYLSPAFTSLLTHNLHNSTNLGANAMRDLNVEALLQLRALLELKILHLLQ